eukprot:15602-Amphidinium_carterae.1
MDCSMALWRPLALGAHSATKRLQASYPLFVQAALFCSLSNAASSQYIARRYASVLDLFAVAG